MNIGLTAHAVIGPWDENCPNDNSRKNNGMPAINSIIAYGIRKAPVKNKQNSYKQK